MKLIYPTQNRSRAMFRKQVTALTALLILCVASVMAQPGKDGALTVSTANTVLNRYTRVTTDILAGSNTVTVTDINELNRDGITYLPGGYVTNASVYVNNAIGAGDLIILYQAQGAIIDNSNALSYGDVVDYNGSGSYELAYVESVSGNTITLSCQAKLSYFAAAYVQVIRVPQYTTLTVNSGASVVAIPWGSPAFGGADPSASQRRRGGFVTALATNIVNDGSINANTAGFRGGTIENTTSSANATFYTDFNTPSAALGAEKGESIAGYRDDYDNLYGGRYGRGAAANGGGGGNAHNAGGGGGANGGNPADWFRGAGVMNDFGGTCGNPGAWVLDPNYIANGNTLTSSSGGGSGGYSYSGLNGDACTLGPSYPANFIAFGEPASSIINTGWGGDNRDAVGGLGGRPIQSSNVRNQIFFGGGGGAGDGNNNANADGGDGGGIVFLVVSGSISGTGLIQSNGQNGANTVSGGNDAPGGGGGGGTVLIQATSVANTVTINANGGNGGSQSIGSIEAEGPGGGGGGGVISINSATDNSTKTVDGGANGRTNGSSLTEFLANGATSGNTGSITSIAVNLGFTPCHTISGSVLNDDNGLSDDLVNGTGTNAGGLNAILADEFTGIVIGVAAVQANGTYTFTGIPEGNYILAISTLGTSLGNTLPTVELPAGWVSTGESLDGGPGGDGSVDGMLSLGTLTSDLSDIFLGIERLPFSDDVTSANEQNPSGTNTITVPVLTGSDPEQGAFTGTGNSDTIVIKTLPTNGTLYYNGTPVVAGDTIKNYNPSLLTLDPDDGLITITFTFTEIDAAGYGSATDGTVTIIFTSSLPVRFSSFTATATNKGALLKWSTELEINSSHFVIERSADGSNFEPIGTVKASGNSNSLVSYSFTDAATLAGNNYYRIKEVDLDGRAQYTNIQLVKTEQASLLLIYPNPSVNDVKIRFSGNFINKQGIIKLLTADGKLVSQKRIGNISSLETVDIRKCSPGNYIIQVITDTEQVSKPVQVIRN